MEQHIKITAKLYRCRDVAKKFWKDQFPEKIKKYIEVIELVMKVHKKNELEALLIISKEEYYESDGMVQMLFMAAIVEMLEPSKEEANENNSSII